MNIETGEIRTFSKDEETQELDGKAGEVMANRWVELKLGEVVEIKGVPCRLDHINEGKRRLSFTVIGRMPRTASGDPKFMKQKRKGF